MYKYFLNVVSFLVPRRERYEKGRIIKRIGWENWVY